MNVDEETKKRHTEISDSKKELKCTGYFIICIIIVLLIAAVVL